MFHKRLRLYRLQANLTINKLAAKVNIKPKLLSEFEAGERIPDSETTKKLATALGVLVSSFLAGEEQYVEFVHAEFRKNSKLNKTRQEYMRALTEDYFNRFFFVVNIMGEDVLPKFPVCQYLELSGSVEKDASNLRDHLNISTTGPVHQLMAILENRGILLFVPELERNFSGMNGYVNKRPYIVINKAMTAERMRSTLVHELAHLMFVWPDEMPDKEKEDRATAIAGAFLFPLKDVKRELGEFRSKVTLDMQLVCKEYGISMSLLAKRAYLCNVITKKAYNQFFIWASSMGWRISEPERIEKEDVHLFEQLVYRAVCEDEFSIQKGADLLQKPSIEVRNNCFYTNK